MLNESLKLPCGAVIKNRLVKAAMTERLSYDGLPNERHVKLYEHWADTEAGLLITGNVLIDHQHLESAGNIVIDANTKSNQLAKWTEAARKNGCHIWAQVSHSGRQTTRFVNSRPKAPSQVQLKKMGLFGVPSELKEAEIHKIIDGFVNAAIVCKEGGFTGVQIHAAHGYLISQFLSPITNKRTDQWGGSIENRSRILREIVSKVRIAVGAEFPIAVKLNSADFQRGGFDENDSLEVIKMLDRLKIDLLEISGGTYEKLVFFEMEPQKESTKRREAYFIEFAEKVRGISTVPLMVTGGFRTYSFANETLESGEVDLIGMARPFILNSHQIRQFINGEIEKLDEVSIRTGLASLKDSAEAGFYARNIFRLSQGKPINTELSPLVSSIVLIVNELRKAVGRK
ncbi:MAG: NADH:flavin oxidoreductase/NADH oxidase family protein [Bacteroidota bacterium]